VAGGWAAYAQAAGNSGSCIRADPKTLGPALADRKSPNLSRLLTGGVPDPPQSHSMQRLVAPRGGLVGRLPTTRGQTIWSAAQCPRFRRNTFGPCGRWWHQTAYDDEPRASYRNRRSFRSAGGEVTRGQRRQWTFRFSFPRRWGSRALVRPDRDLNGPRPAPPRRGVFSVRSSSRRHKSGPYVLYNEESQL